MAHIIGYVGRINLEELKTIDPTNYQGTNFIGKLGIEKYYENILHGTVGYEQVETNVSGKIIRVIDKQPPVSGHKVYLTLDSRLQHVAYDALKDLEGSAVLIDVKDGGVLAMVSRPSYNPNAFTKGISNQDYLKLMNSVERPLLHRAIRGLYPPRQPLNPLWPLQVLSIMRYYPHFQFTIQVGFVCLMLNTITETGNAQAMVLPILNERLWFPVILFFTHWVQKSGSITYLKH